VLRFNQPNSNQQHSAALNIQCERRNNRGCGAVRPTAVYVDVKPFVERVCSDGQAIAHISAARPETKFGDAALWP